MKTTGYAPINGLSLYYEIHGAGEPLVLIHGGFGSVDMFGGLIDELAKTRQVIPIEMQGHARTADADRPLTYEQLADDLAGLIGYLGFARSDVLGYSLGGGATWQTAIRHPDVVRRFVIVSAPCRRSAWFPEVLAGMASIQADSMAGSFMQAAYAKVAPNPEHFARLVDKTRTLLGNDYDWSSAVAAIKVPGLIVCADADSFAPAHFAEVFGLLGGGKVDAGWDGSARPSSQLAILPGATHYNILQAPGLAGLVTRFLHEQPPAGKP